MVVSAVEPNLADGSDHGLDCLWSLVVYTIAAAYRDLKTVPVGSPHAVDATGLNCGVYRAFCDSYWQQVRSQLL